jgi:hypothetical protein
MVVETKLEPVKRYLQSVEFAASVSGDTADTQPRIQKKLGELREVIEAWAKLFPALRRC